jgi:VanZ family protein
LTFRAYTRNQRRLGIASILLLSLFMLLAGSFDEWHQSFVPGRHSAALDAIFDYICATSAILICSLAWKSSR